MAENNENMVGVIEPINYEDVGKVIARIRKKHNLTQEDVAKDFHVSRTVISKYENGTVIPPNWDAVVKFAKKYNENLEALRKKVSIAIPDTCALLKNKRLLHMLLEDYNQVVIPSTVWQELSEFKNQANERNRKIAWQVMANIDYYKTEYPKRLYEKDSTHYKVDAPTSKMEKDAKIATMAKDLAKNTIGDVVIITDDVDYSLYYDKKIKLYDYMARRTNTSDYEDIINLEQEYKDLRPYEKLVDRLDLDTYLPDGMTLLISCIRCRTKEKVEQWGDRMPSEKAKYEKMRFLIENGADINKNDNARYCFPPLAHCVQINDWEAFNILLDAGCDYNKGSRDERTASYLKVGKLNEGNTPLMIACFSGRKKFVEKLCSFPDISINQQDSNGYTALIKCAVARYRRKKEDKPYDINEKLYNYLLEDKGADPLIRDRNNHTAEDWWNRGNDFEYKGDEQW